MSRKNWLFSILVILLFVTLACEINVGGPERSLPPIPVSTDSLETLKETWAQAFEDLDGDGSITLTLNESQLTSLLADRLETQEDPLFTDPQVYLRDGEIQIYGVAHRGVLTARIRMVLSVLIDENGGPQFTLSSADFGPWPVPEGLLDGVSGLIDEAFTGQFGPVATGLRIEGILIQDGYMAITGRIK